MKTVKLVRGGKWKVYTIGVVDADLVCSEYPTFRRTLDRGGAEATIRRLCAEDGWRPETVGGTNEQRR